MAERKKKKMNPLVSALFFVVIMSWLIYSNDKMNIWISGAGALVLTAILVVITIAIENKGQK